MIATLATITAGAGWLRQQASPASVSPDSVQRELWAQVNNAPAATAQAHAAGVAATAQGDYETAAGHFRRALSHSPALALGWYHLGVANTHTGRQRDALVAYRRALELEPRFAEAWFNLGMLQTEQSDFKAAKDALNQAVTLNPNLEQAQLALARACLKMGETKTAEELARAALQRAPHSANAWLALGDMLAESPAAQATEEAMQCFDRAARMKVDAYANLRLGQMALRLKRTDIALRALSRAVSLDASNPAAWYLLARGQQAAGRKEASATLERARRIHQWAHQAKVLRVALEQKPEDATLHFKLGAAQARQGDLEAAIHSYHDGLRLAPDNVNARRALAALETKAKS